MRDLRSTYHSGASRGSRRVTNEPVLATANVSFNVVRGEVFGILGPNGAGKTTLLRQMLGLRRPDSGVIRLLGHDVIAEPKVPARFVAYLAQDEVALHELPVATALETTGRLRGLAPNAAREQCAALIAELGLDSFASRSLSTLSGGERRMVGVACALIAERPVLVLDEPTTGMDPFARRSVWDAIDKRRATQGTTVVLVTHNVLEAELVLDRVAVLEAGSVVACDTPGRLKAAVGQDVRLNVVWRDDPPMNEPAVAALAAIATITGRRWSARLPQKQARTLLGKLTSGAAFAALDDFSLATPTLEDVYLSLGGRSSDLEHS